MTNDNRPVNTWIASGMRLKPKSLTDEQILKLNHVEWLEGAVHTLSQETGVQKTPFLLGLITRLGWLSRYVRLLEDKNAALEHDLTLALGALKIYGMEEKPDDH